jgi:multisubunit Na+/H+ antiporter MnhG subunit
VERRATKLLRKAVLAGALSLPRLRRILVQRMKIPDLYRDWRIVLGIALTVLGAADWFIGFERTHQYSQMIAALPHGSSGIDFRSFDELDPASGGAAVLDPLTAEERQVSYATARMDFYHATFLTGQVLVLAGVLLTFVGFLGVIQSDTRKTLKRMLEQANAPPPDQPPV